MPRFSESALLQTSVGRANLQKQRDPIRFSIGIDPGKHTGFAVWNRELKQFDIIETSTTQSALQKCRAYSPAEVVITVEVPATKANFHSSRSHTQSVNIGIVIGQARLIADILKSDGYTVIEKHPQGKMTAEKFKRLTGYAGRTNEHSRDAGYLAFAAA